MIFCMNHNKKETEKKQYASSLLNVVNLVFSSSEEISRRRFDLRWRHDPFRGGRPHRLKEWINGFSIVYRRFSRLCTSWVKIKQRFCRSQVLYFFFQNNWKPCTRTRMILPLVIDNKKIFRVMGFVDHMTPASSDSTFSKNMPTVRWWWQSHWRWSSSFYIMQLVI